MIFLKYIFNVRRLKSKYFENKKKYKINNYETLTIYLNELFI